MSTGDYDPTPNYMQFSGDNGTSRQQGEGPNFYDFNGGNGDVNRFQEEAWARPPQQQTRNYDFPRDSQGYPVIYNGRGGTINIFVSGGGGGYDGMDDMVRREQAAKLEDMASGRYDYNWQGSNERWAQYQMRDQYSRDRAIDQMTRDERLYRDAEQLDRFNRAAYNRQFDDYAYRTPYPYSGVGRTTDISGGPDGYRVYSDTRGIPRYGHNPMVIDGCFDPYGRSAGIELNQGLDLAFSIFDRIAAEKIANRYADRNRGRYAIQPRDMMYRDRDYGYRDNYGYRDQYADYRYPGDYYDRGYRPNGRVFQTADISSISGGPDGYRVYNRNSGVPRYDDWNSGGNAINDIARFADRVAFPVWDRVNAMKIADRYADNSHNYYRNNNRQYNERYRA